MEPRDFCPRATFIGKVFDQTNGNLVLNSLAVRFSDRTKEQHSGFTLAASFIGHWRSCRRRQLTRRYCSFCPRGHQHSNRRVSRPRLPGHIVVLWSADMSITRRELLVGSAGLAGASVSVPFLLPKYHFDRRPKRSRVAILNVDQYSPKL